MSFEVKQFSPYNLSPKLPDGQEGVAIKVNLLETNIFMLNGICQASKKTVEILSDTILHNLSIFGVCGVALSPFAFPVVNRELVFPED
ncbi:MAG TPA: hypothetical protein ENK06_00455, partial [Gammaproteobacteria bacterium]|nr:hypothetical protein [Gammaproteobacteria bacterium]